MLQFLDHLLWEEWLPIFSVMVLVPTSRAQFSFRSATMQLPCRKTSYLISNTLWDIHFRLISFASPSHLELQVQQTSLSRRPQEPPKYPVACVTCKALTIIRRTILSVHTLRLHTTAALPERRHTYRRLFDLLALLYFSDHSTLDKRNFPNPRIGTDARWFEAPRGQLFR